MVTIFGFLIINIRYIWSLVKSLEKKQSGKIRNFGKDFWLTWQVIKVEDEDKVKSSQP